MVTLKISRGTLFPRIVVEPSQIMLIYTTIVVNVFSSAAAFFYPTFRYGSDLNEYPFQQLRNECTLRTLDRFMAFRQGRGGQNLHYSALVG